MAGLSIGGKKRKGQESALARRLLKRAEKQSESPHSRLSANTKSSRTNRTIMTDSSTTLDQSAASWSDHKSSPEKSGPNSSPEQAAWIAKGEAPLSEATKQQQAAASRRRTIRESNATKDGATRAFKSSVTTKSTTSKQLPLQIFPATSPGNRRRLDSNVKSSPVSNTGLIRNGSTTVTPDRSTAWKGQQNQFLNEHRNHRQSLVDLDLTMTSSGDTNDSLSSGSIQVPQHLQTPVKPQQQHSFLISPSVVGELMVNSSLKCLSRGSSKDDSPPSTPLSSSDVASDFSRASTDVATNRAVDMARERIQRIEAEGEERIRNLDDHRIRHEQTQSSSRHPQSFQPISDALPNHPRPSNAPPSAALPSQEQQKYQYPHFEQQQYNPFYYRGADQKQFRSTEPHQQQQHQIQNHPRYHLSQQSGGGYFQSAPLGHSERVHNDAPVPSGIIQAQPSGRLRYKIGVPGVNPKPMEAKSILSEDSNDDSTRVMSPGPFLPPHGNHRPSNAVIQGTGGAALQNEYKDRQTGVDPRQATVFRPRSSSQVQQLPVLDEKEDADLWIPQLRTNSTSEEARASFDAASAWALSPNATNSPDPVFCPDPDTPSTKESSYGSDYVSTAHFGERSISSPEDRSSNSQNVMGGRYKEENETAIQPRKINFARTGAVHPVGGHSNLRNPVQSFDEEPDDLFTRTGSDEAILPDSQQNQGIVMIPQNNQSIVRASLPGSNNQIVHPVPQEMPNKLLADSAAENKQHFSSTPKKSKAIDSKEDSLFRTRSTVQKYALANKAPPNTFPAVQDGNDDKVRNVPNNLSKANPMRKSLEMNIPKHPTGYQVESKKATTIEAARRTASPMHGHEWVQQASRTTVAERFLASISKSEDAPNVNISNARGPKKLAKLLDAASHDTQAADVQSVRSAFESLSRGEEIDDDDDDDDNSVRSLKEIFEKAPEPVVENSGFQKAKSMFESKKPPSSTRFSRGKSVAKESYSKFEMATGRDKGTPKHVPFKRTIAGEPRACKAAIVPATMGGVSSPGAGISKEAKKVTPPRISVAARIRALAESNENSRNGACPDKQPSTEQIILSSRPQKLDPSVQMMQTARASSLAVARAAGRYGSNTTKFPITSSGKVESGVASDGYGDDAIKGSLEKRNVSRQVMQSERTPPPTAVRRQESRRTKPQLPKKSFGRVENGVANHDHGDDAVEVISESMNSSPQAMQSEEAASLVIAKTVGRQESRRAIYPAKISEGGRGEKTLEGPPDKLNEPRQKSERSFSSAMAKFVGSQGNYMPKTHVGSSGKIQSDVTSDGHGDDAIEEASEKLDALAQVMQSERACSPARTKVYRQGSYRTNPPEITSGRAHSGFSDGRNRDATKGTIVGDTVFVSKKQQNITVPSLKEQQRTPRTRLQEISSYIRNENRNEQHSQETDELQPLKMNEGQLSSGNQNADSNNPGENRKSSTLVSTVGPRTEHMETNDPVTVFEAAPGTQKQAESQSFKSRQLQMDAGIPRSGTRNGNPVVPYPVRPLPKRVSARTSLRIEKPIMGAQSVPAKLPDQTTRITDGKAVSGVDGSTHMDQSEQSSGKECENTRTTNTTRSISNVTSGAEGDSEQAHDNGQSNDRKKSDSDTHTSDEFSDGVTLDLSLADVSNLTDPTAIQSVKTETIMDDVSSAKTPSDNEARKSEASSSQTSEAMAPLIARAMRMRPMSDELSADSFFARRAQMAGQREKAEAWESRRHAESNALQMPSASCEAAHGGDDEWNSSWDAQQIATTFPLTCNTSSVDFFDFDSEWKTFHPTTFGTEQISTIQDPPAVLHKHVAPAIVGSAKSRSVLAAPIEAGAKPTQSTLAPQSHNPKSPEKQGYLLQETNLPVSRKLDPVLQRTKAVDLVAPSLHAIKPTGLPVSPSSPPELPRRHEMFGRTYPGRRNEDAVWKKRLGHAASQPERQSVDTAHTRSPRDARETNIMQPAPTSELPSASGLPPRQFQSDLPADESRHSALLGRLKKLKEARIQRANAIYNRRRPVSTRLYQTPFPEPDEFSSSTLSSTRFGGNTFMANLEVD